MQQKDNKVYVDLSNVEYLTTMSLLSLGLNSRDAETVKRVLLYAELRGSTQGLVKIKERTVVPDGAIKPMKIENKSVAVSNIHANGQLGMVVLTKAVQLAIAAAQKSGISLVGTTGTSTSTGAIGYYAEVVARSGLIGLVFAGSPKTTCIHGGIDPVFGTNPLAIAVPTADEPLVLDMATAATTWFGLIQARDNQEPIDANLAYDNHGNETSSPEAALAGALRTFGGAKGSGIALMIELLTGPLVGANIINDEGDNRGNLVIAIDPEMFGERVLFEKRVSLLLSRIRNSGRQSDTTLIRFPGENSREKMAANLKTGKIWVNKDVYSELQCLAKKYQSEQAD